MVATIGEFPIGSCVSVGTLGFKMRISIIALFAAQEALVLLLLVPAGSYVIVASIGKFPTGSSVLVGKMGISVPTTSIVHESLVLLLLDDSPYVSASSFVTMASIGKMPTGSCVSMGKWEFQCLPLLLSRNP